jgi:hypothetical protein
MYDEVDTCMRLASLVLLTLVPSLQIQPSDGVAVASVRDACTSSSAQVQSVLCEVGRREVIRGNHNGGNITACVRDDLSLCPDHEYLILLLVTQFLTQRFGPFVK